MSRVFGFIFSIPMWVLYPFIVLIVIIGPIMCASDAWNMMTTGAPTSIFPIDVLGILGLYLFSSIRWRRIRRIYTRFPVLLPMLQMAFIMFVVFDLCDVIFQAWADHEAFPKGVAVTLSLVIILLGRVYMSYWYTKHPISAKMRRM